MLVLESQSVLSRLLPKRFIRGCVDRAAFASGLVARMQSHMGVGLTVLTYHRVLPAASCRRYQLPGLAIPAPVFREHVRMLADRFEVLPLGKALTALASRSGRGRALVAVTFDDGYADNRDTAAPILEEYGLRATFFPVTGFVAGHGLLWFDRARLAVAGSDTGRREQAWNYAQAHLQSRPESSNRAAIASWIELLKRVPAEIRATTTAMLEAGQALAPSQELAAMRPTDIAELAQRGHEIGSHSVSHSLLPQVDDEQLAHELGRSRADLQNWAGAPVTGFCYPNGDCDERVVRAAKAAGYRYACTTLAGINAPDREPLRLARTDITMQRVCTPDGQHSPIAFMAEVCGLHQLLRRARNLGRRP